MQNESDASLAHQHLDPQMLERVRALRGRLHSVFAQVTMALMSVPRYRHHTIADLQHLVLEPMIRDRVAVAAPPHKEGELEPPMAGVAFWAKVSAEVDAKIREQIKAGVFPVRLKAEEWDCGDIAWLLDVVAPTKKQATSVLANFHQVVKDGKLFIHPAVRGLVEGDVLNKAATETPAAPSATVN